MPVRIRAFSSPSGTGTPAPRCPSRGPAGCSGTLPGPGGWEPTGQCLGRRLPGPGPPHGRHASRGARRIPLGDRDGDDIPPLAAPIRELCPWLQPAERAHAAVNGRRTRKRLAESSGATTPSWPQPATTPSVTERNADHRRLLSRARMERVALRTLRLRGAEAPPGASDMLRTVSRSYRPLCCPHSVGRRDTEMSLEFAAAEIGESHRAVTVAA